MNKIVYAILISAFMVASTLQISLAAANDHLGAVKALRGWYPKIIEVTNINIGGVKSGIVFTSTMKDAENNVELGTFHNDFNIIYIICDSPATLNLIKANAAVKCDQASVEQNFKAYPLYKLFYNDGQEYVLDYMDASTNVVVLPENYVILSEYTSNLNVYVGKKLDALKDKPPQNEGRQKEELKNNLLYIFILLSIVIPAVVFSMRVSITDIYNNITKFYRKNFWINAYMVFIEVVGLIVLISIAYLAFGYDLRPEVFIQVFQSHDTYISPSRQIVAYGFSFFILPLLAATFLFFFLGLIIRVIDNFEIIFDKINRIKIKYVYLAVNLISLGIFLYSDRPVRVSLLVFLSIFDLLVQLIVLKFYKNKLIKLRYVMIFLLVLSFILFF